MAQYEVICPHCDYVNAADPYHAGQAAGCANCRQAVVIPIDILVDEINDRQGSLYRIIKWSLILAIVCAGFIAMLPPFESTNERVIVFFAFLGSGLFAFPSLAFSFKCLGRWLIVAFACGGEIAAVFLTMLVFPFAGPICALWFIYDLQRLKGRLREVAPELFERAAEEVSVPATTAFAEAIEPREAPPPEAPPAETATEARAAEPEAPEEPEESTAQVAPGPAPSDTVPAPPVQGPEPDEPQPEAAPEPPDREPAPAPSVAAAAETPLPAAAEAQPEGALDRPAPRAGRAAMWVTGLFFGAFVILALVLGARQFASLRNAPVAEPLAPFEEPPLAPEEPTPEPTPPTPPPSPVPQRIVLEGEEFEGLAASNRDGWKIDDASGGTGGLSLATRRPEAEVREIFNVEAAGEYEVLVAMASLGSTELLRIDNQQFVAHAERMQGATWRSVPWTNVRVGRVKLDAGQHTLRFWHVASADPGAPDSIYAFGLVDNVQLVPASETPPPPPDSEVLLHDAMDGLELDTTRWTVLNEGAQGSVRCESGALRIQGEFPHGRECRVGVESNAVLLQDFAATVALQTPVSDPVGFALSVQNTKSGTDEYRAFDAFFVGGQPGHYTIGWLDPTWQMSDQTRPAFGDEGSIYHQLAIQYSATNHMASASVDRRPIGSRSIDLADQQVTFGLWIGSDGRDATPFDCRFDDFKVVRLSGP